MRGALRDLVALPNLASTAPGLAVPLDPESPSRPAALAETQLGRACEASIQQKPEAICSVQVELNADVRLLVPLPVDRPGTADQLLPEKELPAHRANQLEGRRGREDLHAAKVLAGAAVQSGS